MSAQTTAIQGATGEAVGAVGTNTAAASELSARTLATASAVGEQAASTHASNLGTSVEAFLKDG